MLVTEISSHAARERTPLAATLGAILAAATIGFMAIGSAMEATYADLTESLPEAYTGIIGSGQGNYIVDSMFGVMAPIAVLVVAITSATRVLAREENRRTADLLLTQPVTRHDVVVSKAVVMVSNIALTCLGLGAGAVIGSMLVNLDGVTPGRMIAGTLHVFFLGLAFGMIALAAANISGSAALGTGTTAALALVANLVAGVVPLVDGISQLAKVSPWYYFNGSDPLVNGVAVGHLAVLTAIALVSFTAAYVVTEHRDMGSYRGVTLMDRVRNTVPSIGMVTRPAVSSVFGKSLTERQTTYGVVSASMFALGVWVSLMYNGLERALQDFASELPESFDGLIGSSDISTPVGWIQAEMLAITMPIALIAVAIHIGVAAIAGEADRGTLATLVTQPITRTSIVVHKALALAVGLTVVATVTAAGLGVGSAAGGLDLGTWNIVGAVTHIGLLALFFGTLALAAGARWDKSRALQLVGGFAVATYLADWLLGIFERTDQFAVVSPWFYATDAEALANGANFVDLGVLVALCLAGVVVATQWFDEREIHA